MCQGAVFPVYVQYFDISVLHCTSDVLSLYLEGTLDVPCFLLLLAPLEWTALRSFVPGLAASKTRARHGRLSACAGDESAGEEAAEEYRRKWEGNGSGTGNAPSLSRNSSGTSSGMGDMAAFMNLIRILAAAQAANGPTANGPGSSNGPGGRGGRCTLISWNNMMR